MGAVEADESGQGGGAHAPWAELDRHGMRGLGKKEATTAALWRNPSVGSAEQWVARRKKNTVKRRNRVLNLQPPETLFF